MAINTIGLGFPIFFPAAVPLSHKRQVASLVYLKMTYPTPICANVSTWLFSRPPLNLSEYSKIVSDEHYCFWFPIFLPFVEQ